MTFNAFAIDPVNYTDRQPRTQASEGKSLGTRLTDRELVEKSVRLFRPAMLIYNDIPYTFQ